MTHGEVIYKTGKQICYVIWEMGVFCTGGYSCVATQGVCLLAITNELKKFTTSSSQIWSKEPVLCKEKALAVMSLLPKNWNVYEHQIVFLFRNQWRVWELRYLGLQDLSMLGDNNLIIKGHFLYKLCLGMSYNPLFLEIYKYLCRRLKRTLLFHALD